MKINGRHYDHLTAGIYRTGRHLTLKFHKHTFEKMGNPKYIKFYTKHNKIGIETFQYRPEKPYNKISEGHTASLAWFIGTEEKNIIPGHYEIKWQKNGLWTFEPETEPVEVNSSWNRFSEKYPVKAEGLKNANSLAAADDD